MDAFGLRRAVLAAQALLLEPSEWLILTADLTLMAIAFAALHKQRPLSRIPDPAPLPPHKLRHPKSPAQTPPTRLHKDRLHPPAPCQHRIPNQRPVAPPRHRLRTHHYRKVEVRQLHQPIPLAIERPSLHIIRIPP